MEQGMNMTRLIVYTQVFENYAMHDGGDREHGDHWKAKGGSEYSIVVQGADMSNLTIEQIETAIQDAMKEIEQDNRYYREYVVGRPEVLEEGQLTEFEQSQLDYEGSIRFPPTVINV